MGTGFNRLCLKRFKHFSMLIVGFYFYKILNVYALRENDPSNLNSKPMPFEKEKALNRIIANEKEYTFFQKLTNDEREFLASNKGISVFNSTVPISNEFKKQNNSPMEIHVNFRCDRLKNVFLKIFSDNPCANEIPNETNLNKALKSKIIEEMNVWSKYANLKFIDKSFMVVNNPDKVDLTKINPDRSSKVLVDVLLCTEDCPKHNHYALSSLQVPQILLDLETPNAFGFVDNNDVTKGYNQYTKFSIQHETGHIIGLGHEQYNAGHPEDSEIVNIDKDRLLQFLTTDNNFMYTPNQANNAIHQYIWVNTKYNQTSSFDVFSIMKYPLSLAYVNYIRRNPSTKDDAEFEANLKKLPYVLSLLDKVAISIVYPGRKIKTKEKLISKAKPTIVQLLGNLGELDYGEFDVKFTSNESKNEINRDEFIKSINSILELPQFKRKSPKPTHVLLKALRANPLNTDPNNLNNYYFEYISHPLPQTSNSIATTPPTESYVVPAIDLEKPVEFYF